MEQAAALLDLAQSQQGFGFTVSVAILPARVKRLLVHLPGIEEFSFREQCGAQPDLGERHAVVVSNVLVRSQSFLMFLQGSANVPQEKRDFTQIMEFAGNAVHIPYVFMDRQRFLVSLPRGEIVSSKHQRDGFPGFRVSHSPLVMSGKIQFSRSAHGLIRFVQAPQLFQQPRMSE